MSCLTVPILTLTKNCFIWSWVTLGAHLAKGCSQKNVETLLWMKILLSRFSRQSILLLYLWMKWKYLSSHIVSLGLEFYQTSLSYVGAHSGRGVKVSGVTGETWQWLVAGPAISDCITTLINSDTMDTKHDDYYQLGDLHTFALLGLDVPVNVFIFYILPLLI